MSAIIKAMQASLDRIEAAQSHPAFGKSPTAQAILYCKAEELKVAIAAQAELEDMDRREANEYLNG